MKRTVTFLTLLLSLQFSFSQTNELIINSNIKLPKDSIESTLLITCVNNFLNSIKTSNENNKYILPSEKIETIVLLNQLYNIQNSKSFNDATFYKPYLTNIINLTEEKYLLQLSYIGINKNTPYVKIALELIAHRVNQSFLFSSTLIDNTKNWKIFKANNVVFHFKDTINKEKVMSYDKHHALFDEKLKLKNKISELYLTNNFVELLKLIGIQYKSDYNGKKEGAISSVFENKKLIITGVNNTLDNFDPHDLWHNRLSLALSKKLINKPIDEACAYLYAGSWGMTWEEILKKFNKEVLNKKDNDWLNYKKHQTNFGDSNAEHLMIDYVIDALIIKKIEKEKGFSSVLELLSCGPYEKENTNYYKTLEKLTGITKQNYNKEVWKLIKNEKLINL